MDEIKEEEILKTIIEKNSWEEVIYYVVEINKIDPWNVDIVRLTSAFLDFIYKAKLLDFRIPAKVVFVAALLLKLKSDRLSFFEEEFKERKEEEIELKETEILKPLSRIPKRQVTLNELIAALKKALEVKERKEERNKRAFVRLEEHLKIEEDFEERIESVMRKIEELIKYSSIIEFEKIVEEWKRESIVKNFVSVLHLEQRKRISTYQEDFFKKIYIVKR